MSRRSATRQKILVGPSTPAFYRRLLYGAVVAGAAEDGGGVVASGFGVTCPEAPVVLFDVPVLFGDEPASFSGWLELL